MVTHLELPQHTFLTQPYNAKRYTGCVKKSEMGQLYNVPGSECPQPV